MRPAKYPFKSVHGGGTVVYKPHTDDIKLAMRRLCRAAWHYRQRYGVRLSVKTVGDTLLISGDGKIGI